MRGLLPVACLGVLLVGCREKDPERVKDEFQRQLDRAGGWSSIRWQVCNPEKRAYDVFAVRGPYEYRVRRLPDKDANLVTVFEASREKDSPILFSAVDSGLRFAIDRKTVVAPRVEGPAREIAAAFRRAAAPR